jgi:glycosyltransferase involved in cell wall biosynthesis
MIQATIVGDGELRARLEERAGELGLRENVMFAGQQRDVGPWLAGARVFVLTSDWEGLSLALLEAMLRGLPAVVSRVGDLGEAVKHGVNGYLVEDRTPAAFANPILELLGDPERLERFGAAARETSQRFEVGAAVLRWDEVLAGFGNATPALDSLPNRRTEEELLRARGR